MARTGARYVAYSVDRKNVTDYHQMILLAPMGTYTFPKSVIAGLLLCGKPLERFDPIVGTTAKFARMYVQRKEGLFVSTARCGSYLSSYTSAGVDSALRSVAKNSGVTLTLGTVQSHVKLRPTPEEFESVRQECTVLLDYFLNCEDVQPRVIVYPVDKAVRAFEANYVDSPPDPAGKKGMVAFMQPLVHEGFTPIMSKNNERRAIEGRVLESRSNVSMTSEVQAYLNEFVDFVVPEEIRGTLHPVEVEEVALRQAEPRQKKALRMAMWLLSPFRRFWEMFLKKEAYGKVTDPRLIIQVDPAAKMTISRYMYAMQPILKACHWYAPGKTPTAIAARVVEICQNAQSISDDDANRMDAHISPAARAVDKAVDIAAFAKVHHEEIERFHAESRALPVTSTSGLKYISADEWGSGDPRTSNSQTLRAAFIHYVAFRREGKTKQDAWDSMGLYAGDDGFTADLRAEAIVQAASLIGQDYTVNVIERGRLGVQFLGRYYGPGVWAGDDNSVCHISRALAKLHLAVPGQFTPAEKVAQKAHSFMLTDANTPVIGEWAARVVKSYPLVRETLDARDVSWWTTKYQESDLWPNQVGTWAQELLATQLPTFDYKAFREWLSRVDDEGLFTSPLFAIPTEQDKPGMVEIGDPRGYITGQLEPSPLIVGEGEGKPPQPPKDKEEEDAPSTEVMREEPAKPGAPPDRPPPQKYACNICGRLQSFSKKSKVAIARHRATCGVRKDAGK